MRQKGFLMIVLVLVLGIQAYAGWIIKEVARDSEGGEQSYLTYFFQNNWFKVVDSEVTIYDLEKGEMYIIIPEANVYWNGTVMKFSEETQNAAKKQMEEVLKELPPEQREAYTKMMEGMGSGTSESQEDAPKDVKVKKTSETRTLAGYSSQKYEVWVGGNLKENVWISSAVNVQDEIDVDKLAQFMKAMIGSGEEWSYVTSDEYIALLKHGYPLQSIEINEWGDEITEVTEAKKQKIAEYEFSVPQDCRRVTLKEFMQIQGMMETEEGHYYDEHEEYEYRN